MTWIDGGPPSGFEKRHSGGNEYFVHQSSLVCGEIEVGRFTYFGAGSHVVAYSPIDVGSFCRISAGFHCVTHEQHHTRTPSSFMFGDVLDLPWSRGCGTVGLDYDRSVVEPFPVSIGHDVSIGAHVHLFGGLTVGNGCVIRPGSLVNRDCVPYGIYQGTPARLVGMRFDDKIIDQLQSFCWWNQPIDLLKANASFFKTDLRKLSASLDELWIVG